MSNRTTQSLSAGAVSSRALPPSRASARWAHSRRSARTDKKIVLSTWGGDYANLLTKHVSTPVLAPQGWTVVNDEAQVVQRKAKTVAEKRLPKGTSDVQALTATDIAELTEIDVLEKLDLSRLKNAPNIIKTFSIADSPLFSPHIYSGKVVLYNPKLIKDVPKGMDALWDPKNQGKVGIVDIQHVYTTMAAALVGGGKTGDFDKAKKALLDLKKLKPRIYPSNEAIAQALQTEEVGLCIMWKARAVQWQNAGINIVTVAPKEGVISLRLGIRHSEERAEQGRRPTRSSTRRWSRRPRKASPSTWATTRSSATRRSPPTCGSASASRPKRRSCSSTRTSSSWPSGWRSSRTSGTRSSRPPDARIGRSQ